MDRHTLEQIRNQVDELLRHGSPNCCRQAKCIMAENFGAIVRFAIELTEPKSKPKHIFADNYPAGGLTATEPCMYCEDYAKIEQQRDDLLVACKAQKEFDDWYGASSTGRKLKERARELREAAISAAKT